MQKVEVLAWERNVNQYILDYESGQRESELKYALGAFFNHLKYATNFADNTIRIRYSVLNIFRRWLETENITELKLITTSILRKYLFYCQNTRGQQGSMLKCSKVALKHFFAYLAKSKMIPHDPAEILKTPTKVVTKNQPILSLDEILALFEATEAELVRIQNSSTGKINNDRRIFTATRNIAIVGTLLATGLRTEEVCLIRLGDLDLKQGFIHIRGKGDDLFIKRYRKVYIAIPQIIAAISAYLNLRTGLKDPTLFLSWSGHPLRSASIIRIVKNYALKAGITRNVTPLLLRHTFCSHLVNQGADLFSVRELMGHKKILTTLHYYIHFSSEKLKQQMLAFNPLQDGDGLC